MLIHPPAPATVTRPALDLARYHARHTYGDITLYLTWWLAEDSGPRPCIVLVPTHKRSHRPVPCVVHLNGSWVWSEEIGDPVRAANMAIEFVDLLGQPPSPQSAFRIRGIIIDHLQDLLTIPPMPDDMRVNTVVGEARITNREAGTTVRHEEIVDRV